MPFAVKLLAAASVAALALTSVAEAGPAAKRQRPADLNEGAVYGLTAKDCGLYGGTSMRDGNGLDICSFGTPVASFNCAGAGPVSVLKNRFGETFLSRGGALEKVRQVPSGSGAMWAGDTTTLHSKGSEALLDGPGGRSTCAAPPPARGAKGDRPKRRDDSQEPGAHRN